MMFDEMIQATKEALSTRDSRRNQLAARIESLATEAMNVARASSLSLGDDTGSIGIEELSATCSQWADGSRATTGSERRTVLRVAGEVRALSPVDLSFFDGHNRQHQRGATRDESGAIVRPATVAQLRAAARALPSAIATLLRSAAESAATESEEAQRALADVSSDDFCPHCGRSDGEHDAGYSCSPR